MNTISERTTGGFHKQPGPTVGSAALVVAVITAVTVLLLVLALVGAGTCW